MNPTMKVGEVFLPDDRDFEHFRNECINDQGWTICYDKSACRVATKKNSLSAFDVIRVRRKQTGFFPFPIRSIDHIFSTGSIGI